MLIAHQRDWGTVEIAVDATESTAIALDNAGAVSLIFPAAMDGATISFKNGPAGSEADVYRDGTLLTVSVAVGGLVQVPLDALIGPSLIVVSDTTETAARVFYVCRLS